MLTLSNHSPVTTRKAPRLTCRTFLLPTLIALTGGLISPLVRADEEGAALAWKYHCVTCHGQNGVANSDRYPNIARQNVAYLISRLRYFRDGGEVGNQMNAQAAPLSDEDIKKLAEYFNQPG